MKEAGSKAMSSGAATGWFYIGLAAIALLGYVWAQARGRGSYAALVVSLALLALGISTIRSGK